IKRQAAESLFNFYLRKKKYAKAEEYLKYFPANDPMKMIYQGRLYQAQGDKENAYKTYENVLFSAHQTLKFSFNLMMGLAIEDGDFEKAHYLAEKMGAAEALFEMGKYNECSPMLDVVCAEKNIEETYRVVVQLLESVDSLCDFQKSRLFQHMKFTKPDSLFLERYQEEIRNLFKNEEEFGYMKGHKDWETLIGKK
ncbi:MAG: transcriptional regulator, partial [Lachnospiraceae bacterium]|nr:transcriptional regulator [Lachnospiraceae bacterium]